MDAIFRGVQENRGLFIPKRKGSAWASASCTKLANKFAVGCVNRETSQKQGRATTRASHARKPKQIHRQGPLKPSGRHYWLTQRQQRAGGGFTVGSIACVGWEGLVSNVWEKQLDRGDVVGQASAWCVCGRRRNPLKQMLLILVRVFSFVCLVCFETGRMGVQRQEAPEAGTIASVSDRDMLRHPEYVHCRTFLGKTLMPMPCHLDAFITAALHHCITADLSTVQTAPS